jgi:hypothetical protein
MLRWIITGFFIIALGAVLLFIGATNNGQNRIFFRNGHFEVPQVGTVNRQLTAFQSARLNIDGADVEIKEGTKYSISGTIADKAALKVSQSGKELVIKYQGEPNAANYYSVGFAKHISQKLVITVPAGAKLTTIATTGSGSDVTMSSLKAKSVAINSTDSAIRMSKVTAGKLVIESDNTSVVLSAVTTQNTSLSTQSADVQVNQSMLGQALLTMTRGALTAQDSTFNQTVAQLTNTDVTTSGQTWQGVNTVSIKNGNFSAVRNTVSGYQLQVTNGTLTVRDNSYTGSYNENDTATDRLGVVVTDGKVVVD